MGWLRALLGIFGAGGGPNRVVETMGAFKANAEQSAQREFEGNSATLSQYAAEFQARATRTWFDSLVDGLNRLVRPCITLSILVPIVAVIAWPEKTAVAFASLALLPGGYWNLFLVVVPFYFGGRMQIKGQDFQKSIAVAVAGAPQVIENIRALSHAFSPGQAASADPEVQLEIAGDVSVSENQAVLNWQEGKT